MPVLNPLLKELNITEMLRYAGLCAKDEKVEALAQKVAKEGLLYFQPRGIWQVYGYEDNFILAKDKRILVASENLRRHLKSSQKVCVLAVTVGEEIEKQVEKLFAKDEYTKAVLLDAAATTATEQVANQLCDFLKSHFQKEGLTPTGRFSPGYGDWPLEEQPLVLWLAEAQEIGLSLTKSCMLVPRKSVSAIVGLKTEVTEKNDARENTCQVCTKTDCRLRRTAKC